MKKFLFLLVSMFSAMCSSEQCGWSTFHVESDDLKGIKEYNGYAYDVDKTNGRGSIVFYDKDDSTIKVISPHMLKYKTEYILGSRFEFMIPLVGLYDGDKLIKSGHAYMDINTSGEGVKKGYIRNWTKYEIDKYKSIIHISTKEIYEWLTEIGHSVRFVFKLYSESSDFDIIVQYNHLFREFMWLDVNINRIKTENIRKKKIEEERLKAQKMHEIEEKNKKIQESIIVSYNKLCSEIFELNDIIKKKETGGYIYTANKMKKELQIKLKNKNNMETKYSFIIKNNEVK